MSGTFALLYQPPCGQWYVHSHKLYPTPEAADAAAVKFLHPDTPRVVIPITFPGTPSQRLDAATVERVKDALGVAYDGGFNFAGGQEGCSEPWKKYAAEEKAKAVSEALALATEPHQHGGKGA